MSNLLDKASILLSPNAYNNGSMLSVKPTNGDGDFTFVRGSAATRVNAQGLVENVQIIGGELVTNGNFSNGSTDWSIEAVWTIGDGVANGNGANGTSEELSQSNVVTIGKTYSISYEVKNYVSGSIRLRKPQTINRNANGTYTEIVTATAASFIFSPSNFNGSITNISVKEIIDDTNIPRINYEGFSYDGNGDIIPNSGCGSWLLEPQSTNLITYSEDFSNWSLSGGSGGSLVPNSVISPDGTQNASSWITNAIGQRIQKPTGSLTNGNAYTFSIYVRADTNLNVGITWAESSALSVAVTTEWQRFEVTQNASGTTGFPQLKNIGNNGTFYVWGAQLEEQSYATSYIPTEGATNTRNQDIATDSGNATLINSTEGVLYAEIAALANDGGNRIISLSTGSQSNRLIMLYTSISNEVRALGSRNSLGQFDISFVTANALDFLKIAVKYKENDFALWVNGSEVATSNIGLTPIGLSELAFDNGGNGSAKFFGKTKCLAVYKEALTDAELQSLTTI